MTINIALVTNDSIVLGCDSLSSMVETAVFPFREKTPFAVDANGDVILDANGSPTISWNADKMVDVAVTVFGGVSKIFCLYDQNDTSVAAVTAGLALVGGVTIAEQAKRFRRTTSPHESVESVAQGFLAFMTDKWEEDFQRSGMSEDRRKFFPNLQFLVAGFGATHDHGKVFRLDVGARTCVEQFPDEGGHAGICWGGMSDYVERLVRGIDGGSIFKVNRQLAIAMAQQREATISDISNAFQTAEIGLPEGLELHITEVQLPTLAWDAGAADIDYGNLSTQYAIDLVELLVNTQSGMQRFARGIPTVGGRTHIGVLRRGEGFELLNEPTLLHKHTGYGDEF